LENAKVNNYVEVKKTEVEPIQIGLHLTVDRSTNTMNIQNTQPNANTNPGGVDKGPTSESGIEKNPGKNAIETKFKTIVKTFNTRLEEANYDRGNTDNLVYRDQTDNLYVQIKIDKQRILIYKAETEDNLENSLSRSVRDLSRNTEEKLQLLADDTKI
jgi:hypothetical protein